MLDELDGRLTRLGLSMGQGVQRLFAFLVYFGDFSFSLSRLCFSSLTCVDFVSVLHSVSGPRLF